MKQYKYIKALNPSDFKTPASYIAACGIDSFAYNELAEQYRNKSNDLVGNQRKTFGLVYKGVTEILCTLEEQMISERNPNGILAILKAYSGERFGNDKRRDELISRNKKFRQVMEDENESLVRLNNNGV